MRRVWSLADGANAPGVVSGRRSECAGCSVWETERMLRMWCLRDGAGICRNCFGSCARFISRAAAMCSLSFYFTFVFVSNQCRKQSVTFILGWQSCCKMFCPLGMDIPPLMAYICLDN